jgi:uncharacterized membrane protein
MSLRYQRARNAALILGVGLGGFIDGITLHQIAHWHQMLSAVMPPESMEAMKRNMVADGWFHLATWLVTLVGVLVLWSAASVSGRLPTLRSFVGYMLIGWGGFNLVEGIVNHHVLELHHVRDLPAHAPGYDWLFLGLSVALVLVGRALREQRFIASTERRSGIDHRASST